MTDLAAIETHWGVRPPAKLASLLSNGVLGYCEPMDPADILGDTERWAAMLPQFLPFAYNDEGLFGLMAWADTLPVLLWNQDEDTYHPVAPDVDAFLARCALEEAAIRADDPDEDAAAALRAAIATYGLPATLDVPPGPGNETMFWRSLLAQVPGCADALAWLGCERLARDLPDEAIGHFDQAALAAPWHADGHYLAAVAEVARGRVREALPRAWNALCCPIALSTTTERYDLGANVPAEQVCLAAARMLRDYEDAMPVGLRGSPLWRLLRADPPEAYEPAARWDLARELEAAGDADGAERELLNGLTLATDPVARGEAYGRLAGFYDAAGRARDAERCRRDEKLDD